ncbi:MAG: hypothetical protein IAE91_13235, partial [Ignavibacteriaceae bacterium]|nr:hypothetical protein [Ignavibacteriaceae bacterium]
MFKSLRFLLVVLMFSTLVMAQSPRVTIKSEALSLQMLTDMGLSTNQASSGLKITANGTYFYFSAFNFGSTQPILTKNFTLETKPAGSNA